MFQYYVLRYHIRWKKARPQILYPVPPSGTWGADAAYRKYYVEKKDSHRNPVNTYLLFYGDRVVELTLPEEPTDAQRAIVHEKLGPHT